MWLHIPSQHAHNPPFITSSGAMRWGRLTKLAHRFLPHAVMTDPHHCCLVSSNTLAYFSEGYYAIPIGILFFPGRIQKLGQMMLDIFHKA
ncbi:hypothetical protein TNCV_546431 [Trichonephila clavipes]|nr:hypothetical protein TNCV_546431 [Trichonephila clavipes]